ncbi:hypothetical protein CORC01_02165 [Colletotrichum orchidophilum]|uniref:Uncharacterized protein n=1 Tax=Colletotrichum orchidophilum TaxID=1209926 RepID=A0A1G4BLX5_9PEZI|nr:uncharacterized protein CORC01_02165 [Colletotrichum orchidophilum]OHF02470.1 hypothetical protein CORC01_02165 [Colletotrichum orchidophilum]
MCTYVYTLHKDCMHKQYQNIFECVSARDGSRSTLYCIPHGNLTLDHTIHLPDIQTQEIPNPMCAGVGRYATRPVTGCCGACKRKEREERAVEAKEMMADGDDDLDAQRAQGGTDTAAGVRTSILGLETLVASTKRMDLED